MFDSSSVGFTTEKKEAVSISLDGNRFLFPDMQPYVNEDDQTMVAVGFISELLETKVEWHTKGGFAKITKGAFEIGIPGRYSFYKEFQLKVNRHCVLAKD